MAEVKRYTVFAWEGDFNTATAIAVNHTKKELERFFNERPHIAVRPQDFIIVEERAFDISVEFRGATGEDSEITVTLAIEE